MDRFITIGRAAVAALALTLVVAACGDDRSPTKVVKQTPAETPVADNPWTSIFAAADALGGPAQVVFAGGNDRSFRVRKLDPGLTAPEDAVEGTQSVCGVDDPADRGALDAFRQCMAKALRTDVCRSGGVFVLLHRPNAVAWRAYCPVSPPEEDKTDREPEDEDDPGRENDFAAASPASLGKAAARLG